jgi:cobalt-zinc-cadmium efflux system protein
MLVIAVFGLVANGLVATVLSRSRNHSLNLKGAFLHVIADALGSVGAISAGLIMFFTGWYQADPIASIMIGVLVFYSSGKIVRDSVNVLLEGVPGHIDLSTVEQRIRGMKGVKNLHDLHVWSIADTNTCCMSSHVVVEDETNGKELVTKLIDILNKEFGIDHTTIQIEDENYPKAAHEH